MTGTAQIQLMHLCSSNFPVGGFTHSYGFETLVENGIVGNLMQFEEYLRNVLKFRLESSELPFLHFIYQQPEQFEEMDSLCTAMKATKELRMSSAKMGKAFCRVFSRMYPDSGLKELLREKEKYDLNYVTVTALAFRYLDIPLEEVMEAYTVNTLMAYIQVGIKLIPLSQIDGQILMAGLYDDIQQTVERALTIESDRMHSFMPEADIASMLHEGQYSRMYIS